MPTTDHRATIIGILDTTLANVQSIESVWRFQLLSNADQLALAIKQNDGCPDDQVDLIIENLIKSPFRRQLGRLRGVRVALQEVRKKLTEESDG